MGPTGLMMQIPGAEFLVGGTQGFLGTETGVVIAMVQVLLPFAVLSILGVISGITPQLEEASAPSAPDSGARCGTSSSPSLCPASSPAPRSSSSCR